jgi:hypothetical protein
VQKTWIFIIIAVENSNIRSVNLTDCMVQGVA